MEIIKDPKQNLAKVWIAAHWDKKLTKSVIMNHSIKESVSTLIAPENTLALRVAGSLLFGIVKLLLKKVVFLIAEAEDLSNKVTLSFNSNESKSKPNGTTARSNTITLSSRKARTSLQSFDGMLSAASILNTTQPSIEVPRNIASNDKITMREFDLTPLSGQFSAEKFRNIQIDMSNNFLEDVAETLHESQIVLDIHPEIPLAPIIFQDDGMDLELPLEPIIEVNSPKQPNQYDIQIPLEEPTPARVKYSRPKNKKRVQNLKRKWREDEETELKDYEEYVKDTSDIVTIHHYKYYRDEEIPIEFDKIFYEPIFKGMNSQIEDFYHAPNKLESVRWFHETDDSSQKMIEYQGFQGNLENDYEINPVPEDNIPDPPEYHENDMQLEHFQQPQEENQFEDSQIELNSRTAKMLGLVKTRLRSAKSISYGKLCAGQDRQSIACGFYELLNLARKGLVNLNQRKEHGDLTIRGTESLSSYNL
jgi:hypothetical protein